MSKFLLVTDLDNTLIGDDVALQALNSWLHQQRKIHDAKLIYATGRSLKSFRHLMTEKTLLEPDVLIASVGAEIYNSNYELDQQWANLPSKWNRDRVSAIAQSFPQLIPQPESEQRPFKLSYLIKSNGESILRELENQLMIHGIEADLIYSNDCDIDIVRRKTNKGSALVYVRDCLGFAPNQTLVCGDSGNDIGLFEVSPIGIIVGNARRELLQWHRDYPKRDRYLAQASYAAGILEGLIKFGLM